LLELLSDVGNRQTLEEAKHLIEGARSLRLPVFDELFLHLTRIKVVRLAYAVADELNLPWKSIAQQHSERLGGGKRWVSVGKTGERLDAFEAWSQQAAASALPAAAHLTDEEVVDMVKALR